MNQILYAETLEKLHILRKNKKEKTTSKQAEEKQGSNIKKTKLAVDDTKKPISEIHITTSMDELIMGKESTKKKKKSLKTKNNKEDRALAITPKTEKNKKQKNNKVKKINNRKKQDGKPKLLIKRVRVPFIILIALLIAYLVSTNFQKTYSSIPNNINQPEITETKSENIENTEEIAEETNEEPQGEEEETIVASDGNEYHTIGIVEVPKLDIKYPILSETTNALLKVSVTKFWGSNPNQVGNMVVVGHNYKNTKMFSKISTLEMGDIIKITDNDNKTLDYKVYDMEKIDPNDTTCTSQRTNGHTEVTLITCADNGKNRFYVKARAD